MIDHLRLLLGSYLMIRICSQASGDYNPSFVTEALKETQYSDTPNQDINLLKDVAVQVYMGKSAYLNELHPF